MPGREIRERKLKTLMIRDLGTADLEESEVRKMNREVRTLPDDELDRMLASRLNLPYPPDPEAFDRALKAVEDPEQPSRESPGGFTGAPDLSHDPRPEEREG